MKKILIADDDLTSRIMLNSLLKNLGYDVISVDNGQDAWDLLQKYDAPSVAVLDWVMPGISGPDLCKKLREQKRVKPLYLILLTAKGEKQDIVVGLASGADDYISKPFDKNELKLRLEIGVRVVETEEQLRNYADHMERIAEERARQLVHADRLATLGALSAGIAHEINNPLTFISGNISLFKDLWRYIRPCLETALEYNIGDLKQITFVLNELPKMIKEIDYGADHIRKIVKGLKNYSRKDDEEFAACNINDCVNEALMIVRNALKYNIKVEKALIDEPPLIMARFQQIVQVLINIFNNAADAVEINQKGMIRITTLTDSGQLIVKIEDDGPGIDEDKLAGIFDAFYSTKPTGKGTGLGLSISKGIMENHGGNLAASNRPEGGACFTMKLPLMKR